MKLFASFAVLAGLCSVNADQLPARAYTTADGLPVNRLNDILADGRGFLWFASDQGLTRFDGYEFHTFGIEDGLPSKVITALLQDRDGSYWLGTNKGLCHFDGHHFTLYPLQPPNVVSALFQDRRGRVWCGSSNGLFILKQPSDGKAFLEQVPVTLPPHSDPTISAITADKAGVIWASFLETLVQLKDSEPPVLFTANDGLPGRISSLLTDKRGRVWVGTWHGLRRLKPAPVPGDALEGSWTRKDGLSSDYIQGLFRSSDGLIWALTEHGLTSWEEASDKPVFRIHQDAQGWLTERDELAAEDHHGSLWIGTETHGVIRVSRNGLTTLGTKDGLLSNKIRDLFADQSGDLVVVTRIDSPEAALNQRYRGQILYHLNEDHLEAVNPRYPQSLLKPGWGESQVALQDHRGEWWITSEQGLFHFPAMPLEKLADSTPLAHYTAADGLKSDDMYRLHEDRQGNIWVGVMGAGVFRWQRTARQFQHIGAGTDSASAFRNDAAGNVWMGWWSRSGVGRFRDGVLETFDARQGLARGCVTDIFLDHLGRLWVTTTGGLSRIDHPKEKLPKIENYSALKIFSGHRLECVTEDASGILYIGTHTGLEAFNPTTGELRHSGMRDGLPDEEVLSAYCDKHGILWFGTHGGLVRLQLPHRPRQTKVPLRITGLQVGGRPWPIATLGETRIDGLRLNPAENMLQIDYADLAFGASGQLLYQYSLQGSGTSWSTPSPERTLHFAGLTPGKYQLSVRAVDVSANPVSDPVTATFRVMPQFWQTWWFQLLCAGLAVTIAVFSHRYSISRLMAVQKLRSRIALDLHDEVGSGLTQIAIWSELARRNGGQDGDDHLEQIAVSSRALVDTIGDIIWTVNPQRDSVRELVQRVRYFATEICTASDINLEFQVNSDELDREANSEVRRDVFLIAKEAIHNAVRHAACSTIEIRFRIFSERLELDIGDNGSGLPARAQPGNGLASMRQRANTLGGRIEWKAVEGSGTTVLVVLPLGSSSLERLLRKLPI